MGNHKTKYQAKIAKQLVNSHENAVYYQHESDQKHPSSEREITDRRKPR